MPGLMNHARKYQFLLATLLIAASGCPAAETPTTLIGDAAGQPPAVEDREAYEAFIAAYETARCERLLRCDASSSYDSAAQCLADLDPALSLMRDRIAAAIEAGAVAYDASFAATCLGELAATCEPHLIPACNRVIDGRLALGEACTGMFACATDGAKRTYCYDRCVAVTGAEPSAATGICVATAPAEGQGCE